MYRYLSENTMKPYFCHKTCLPHENPNHLYVIAICIHELRK